MSFEVRCECGKAHLVTAADAGASLQCSCGRTVEVPPLHQLRTARGKAALSPLVQVRAMLLNGLLPGTDRCACCQRPTKGLVRVAVACKRVAAEGGPSQAEVVGCLLGPLLLGWLLALLLVVGLRTRRAAGEDVTILLPLPVCEACRPGLDDPSALEQALRQIPDYAALLDRYPDAGITYRV